MKKVKKVKSVNLHIRLPEIEKEAFAAAARKAGLDLTTWIRLCLRATCGLG